MKYCTTNYAKWKHPTYFLFLQRQADIVEDAPEFNRLMLEQV